jgi:energy-converting hydrogenase A subunit R
MDSTADKKIFITDCEGPVTKNDNAAELSEAFIPHGDKFFGKISLYDDYLAEIVQRPGYKAGDTLRLILPFFKAFGLDNRSMIKFSRRNISLVPKADEVLKEILGSMPAYVVSTSYSPYIMAVCDAIGFPFLNTFSTSVNLDEFVLKDVERGILKEIHFKIISLPDFSIPTAAKSLNDLSEDDRVTVRVLDDIFWQVLPKLEIYRIVEQVNPVGGREKARAIARIAETEETGIMNVIYVGDSITDVDAFRLVKKSGGLALSFNGNDWAVREASYAVTAQNAFPLAWMAKLFLHTGLDGFEDLMAAKIDERNWKQISETSSRVRKTVRSEKIGSLG